MSEVTFNEIKALRDETGAGLYECKCAIEYANTHKGCTAIGYLKARAIAVYTLNRTFEDRVRIFSNNK